MNPEALSFNENLKDMKILTEAIVLSSKLLISFIVNRIPVNIGTIAIISLLQSNFEVGNWTEEEAIEFIKNVWKAKKEAGKAVGL